MDGGSESSVTAGRGAWWGRQKHSSGAQGPDEGDVQEKQPDLAMANSRSRAGDDSALYQTPLLFPLEIHDLSKRPKVLHKRTRGRTACTPLSLTGQGQEHA